MAQLRGRFEAELTRQATKAAKLATATKLMAAFPPKGSRAKRADRAQQQAHMNKGGDLVTDVLDQSLLGIKPRGRKKKRSALANAANPHHLKNYVPSRLPHSGGQTNTAQTNVNSQNYLGPPPIRFLAAKIPPRRQKKASTTPMAQLANPVDEWICALCEHRLFYGGDQEYRRSVRMRKKILRRRRRARERAATAASGNSTSKLPEKSTQSNEEYEDVGFEPSMVGSVPKPTKLKAGEKGGEHGSFG